MSDLTDLRHEIERYIKRQKKKGIAKYTRMGIKDRINKGLKKKLEEFDEELDNAATELIDVLVQAVMFEIGDALSEDVKRSIRVSMLGMKNRTKNKLVKFLYALIDRVW